MSEVSLVRMLPDNPNLDHLHCQAKELLAGLLDDEPIVGAEADVALQRSAAGAGILLPAPVRSRSGSVVVSIGGQRWRVNQWSHSGPPLVAPVSSTVARSIGRILATIHRLALPVGRVSPYHAIRLFDQVDAALSAGTPDEQRDADRGVGHLLSRPPTRTDLERLVATVAGAVSV